MRKKNGFGLLGLIITLTIVIFLVYFSMKEQLQVNQTMKQVDDTDKVQHPPQTRDEKEHAKPVECQANSDAKCGP